ncbi:MAG: TIM barrel protein, partial [Actinomycetota bacterium]
MSFGFKNMATLDQTIRVLGAFNYDGIELGGFFDHATLERFPTAQSRKELGKWIADNGMVVAGIAPGPYGDLGRLPWATGDDAVYKEYLGWFEEFLQFCVDVGSPALRIDPGSFGPLPYGTDYNATYARVVETYTEHAEKGADVGVAMLWEAECPQPFNKPREVIRIMNDVPHPNFK